MTNKRFKKITNLLTGVILTLTSFSCANGSKQNSSSFSKDTSYAFSNNKPEIDLSVDNYFIIDKDSITISPFEIEVLLSPKAAERINESKETIIVYVFFTGTPSDSSHAKLGEDGSFFVASAKKELVYGEIAKFDSIRFPKKIYNQLADKDIDLGVNVFSGRKSSQSNLLDGGVLFDKISNVVNKKFTLKCKLIYGDD